MRRFPVSNSSKHLDRVRSDDVPPIPRVWLTPEEAASYLSVHIAWLARLRSKGLPGPRFHARGRVVRYHLDDLDSYMRGGVSVQGAPDVER